MKIGVNIDTKRVQEAFVRAPRAMTRNLDRYLGRAAQEVAREERGKAPKAFSGLVNSIRAMRVSPFEWFVAPSKEHAVYVEEGTRSYRAGGGADAFGVMPPVRSILDWIRVKRIQPDDPTTSLPQLAWMIARSIALKGTPAQPYVAPTAEKMRSRVIELAQEGVAQGLKEAFVP